MQLPASGMSREEIFTRFDELAAADVRWRDGRVFSLAYSAGPEVLALAEDAYRRFSGENALNVDAFPSLRRMQDDVVAIARGWLGGPEDTAGFMTSGGTESLLLTVKAARDRGRAERGVRSPNMVLPASAHAALEKGAAYFDVESRRIPVRADWRADADAMAAAIDDDTVLIVASAPQYPQGVIDDVPAIAALATARGVNCHVDACMGGVVLPYLDGVPPWNFDVDGVTSISVDLHKYGYTAKGAGVLVHRSKALRRHQTFVTDNWLGGLYGSSGILGTKSGGSIAAAWAVLHHLGDDGYRRLAGLARRLARRLADAIEQIPELWLLARPDTTLVAFRAADPSTLDVVAVAAALRRRGWLVDQQGPPRSLHCMVNAVHEPTLDAFIADLRECVADAGPPDGAGPSAYATVD
ncbi:MAG: aminotransferase class V-fold PLP-dependent enzyme [Ilumatobacteraceae bacterium]